MIETYSVQENMISRQPPPWLGFVLQ